METDEELPSVIIERAFSGPPETIVEVSVELLGLLASSLSHLIGEDGFESLLNRSVRRVTKQFIWLRFDAAARASDPEFEAMRLCFMEQDQAQVRAASIALFQTLMEILSSLVGVHLTTLILTTALGRAGKIIKEPHHG